MKLLVCGDRNWSSHLIIRQFLIALKPSLVIEGGARGADRIAWEEARSLGIVIIEIKADWDRYGKAAGVIRNSEMLELEPDFVLAFHNDITESKGTADMLCKAEAKGVPYYLVGD